MKKMIVLFLICFSFTAALADESFQHPSLGFSLNYPSDWTTPPQRMAPFLALYSDQVLEKGEENFRIDVVDLSGNGGNSMIANMERMQIERRYPGLKLEKSKPVKFRRIKDAHRFDFVGKHNGQRFHLVKILVFEGARAYKITLGASEKNYKRLSYKFDRVLQSFQVK